MLFPGMTLPDRTIAIKDKVKEVLMFSNQVHINSGISIYNIQQTRSIIAAIYTDTHQLATALREQEDTNPYYTITLIHQLTPIQLELEIHHDRIKRFFNDRLCEGIGKFLFEPTIHTNTQLHNHTKTQNSAYLTSKFDYQWHATIQQQLTQVNTIEFLEHIENITSELSEEYPTKTIIHDAWNEIQSTIQTIIPIARDFLTYLQDDEIIHTHTLALKLQTMPHGLEILQSLKPKQNINAYMNEFSNSLTTMSQHTLLLTYHIPITTETRTLITIIPTPLEISTTILHLQLPYFTILTDNYLQAWNFDIYDTDPCYVISKDRMICNALYPWQNSSSCTYAIILNDRSPENCTFITRQNNTDTITKLNPTEELYQNNTNRTINPSPIAGLFPTYEIIQIRPRPAFKRPHTKSFPTLIFIATLSSCIAVTLTITNIFCRHKTPTTNPTLPTYTATTPIIQFSFSNPSFQSEIDYCVPHIPPVPINEPTILTNPLYSHSSKTPQTSQII